MALSALTTFLVKGLVWDSFQNCTVTGTWIINTKLVKKIMRKLVCFLISENLLKGTSFACFSVRGET